MTNKGGYIPPYKHKEKKMRKKVFIIILEAFALLSIFLLAFAFLYLAPAFDDAMIDILGRRV